MYRRFVFNTFFFSSRRRHTRYIGDWSSDVCSSDLSYLVGKGADRSGIETIGMGKTVPAKFCPDSKKRSEERRVGKEWRSLWRAKHSKKKNMTTRQDTCNATRAHQTTTTSAIARRHT